jgi:hypothetical protein
MRRVVATSVVRICTFTVWFPALSVSLLRAMACDSQELSVASRRLLVQLTPSEELRRYVVQGAGLARPASTGHGGQVVLSEATAELVELALTDLGDHRFKDILDTVSIFRLGDDDSDPDEPLDRIPLVEEDADAREEVSSGFV